MGYYVPQTLQKLNNWALWRLEGTKKAPYSIKYNGRIGVNKPYLWGSYGAAVQKLQYTDDYNGLGFLFTEKCGLVFIDLDHCIDESGELSALASNIIGAFSGTYIEYSQSGRGLHIICKGNIPIDGTRIDKYGIELYKNKHYIAFTGNAYEASEPANKQKELDKLCSFLNITRQTEREQITPEPIRAAADDEIIRRAEKGANGEQFRALWAGEWQERYKTQSNADMRLIALLWYYSGNAEQVARLFLMSGLADRKKAQRTDYIQRTIEAAAANTPTIYQQQTRHRSKPAASAKQPKTYTKEAETSIDGMKVY